MPPPTRLLLTGPTGYIGGSVLTRLLTSTNPHTTSLEISVLTRADARAATFRANPRISTVYTMTSLSDTAALLTAASENDIVLSCIIGYHAPASTTLIRGLARRAATTHTPVLFIHTDGASTLADKPASRAYIETREFSDCDDDLYAYMQMREAREPYIQRATSLAVVQTGLECGVDTVDVMPPTVYGLGSGEFNRVTVQMPMMMRAAVADGYAAFVDEGSGGMGYVHVDDLVALYELVLADWVSGKRSVGTGEKGVVFCATGRYTWKEAAEMIGRMGRELGVLKEERPRSVSLQEGADKWAGGDVNLTETGLVGGSRTNADKAREVLGWKPKKTAEDWERGVREEFEEVLKSQGGEYRKYGEV